MSVNKYYRYKDGDKIETDRYIARVYVGRKSDGSPKQRTKVFDRKKDAERWERKIERRKDLGELVVESSKPYRALVEEWLNVKKPKLAQSTYEGYQSRMENHVLPAFGDMALKDLDRSHFRDFYAQKRETGNKRQDGKGLSESTLKKIHVIMNSSLEWAVKEGYIRQNPLQYVESPTPEETEMTILNPEQTRKLIETCQNSDSIYSNIYPCMALTGLRRSELLGLRTKDVNLQKQKLSVRSVLVRTAHNNYVRKEPKTQASKRTIRLSDRAVQFYEDQFRRRERLERELGDQWPETDLLFTTDRGSRINPSNLHRHRRKLLDQLDIPEVTFHELRHTFGSLLADQEVGLDYIKKHLGHSSIQVTIDIYAHMIPGRGKEATRKVDQLVFEEQ